MNQYLDQLAESMRQRRDAGLVRTAEDDQHSGVRIDLASNDYLGLRQHPDVLAGARDALTCHGSGAGASRLVTGTHHVHTALERELAEHLGHEAALVFSTGYHANLSVMTCLGGPDTLIISDAHNHASLIDGMRLAKAEVRIVPHGDVAAVRNALASRTQPRALVVVESIFSVLGDAAPVSELISLVEEFDALLIVDEAHGLGVVGDRGEGLVATTVHGTSKAADRIVVTLTLSKALASQGGAVLGPRVLREYLLNTARPFIFDTGLAPASAGAALAALRHLRAHPERVTRIGEVMASLAKVLDVPAPPGAVVSRPMPSPQAAVATVEAARAHGLRIGCFRPPSTPDGISRLRLTAHAALSDAQLDEATSILRDIVTTPAITPNTAPPQGATT